MTVRSRFGFFNVVLVLVLFAAACGTAHKSVATEAAGGAAVGTALPIDVRAELSAAQAVDGSIVLVTVGLPKSAQPGQKVVGEFEGIALPFFAAPELGERMYQAVLGVPFAHKPGAASVKVTLGEGQQATSFLLPFAIVEGNYKSEVLKVDERKVNPRKSDLKRIKREIAEAGRIYAHLTERKYWKGPFVLPVESPVTSPFGTKRVFNGEMKSFHKGLDLKAPTGTPIHAPAPGVVVMSKNLFFTGNTVMIDHGYGVITLYAHMSALKVKKGQEVRTGQLLGLSGMTGRANGPHLHWQAVVHNEKVNPLDLTRVMR